MSCWKMTPHVLTSSKMTIGVSCSPEEANLRKANTILIEQPRLSSPAVPHSLNLYLDHIHAALPTNLTLGSLATHHSNALRTRLDHGHL
jgi:hypothetical protein